MKRKVNINRKPLASEEIQATKDFGSLVSKLGAGATVTNGSPKGISNWLIGAMVVAGISVGIYFGTQDNSDDNSSTNLVEAVNTDSTRTLASITPPIQSADIPNESYFVNADKGGTIKHHTGTEITIPQGAFMNEDGTIVSGDVEVQYREFHDQADIFLSGIPMEYDTAGETHIFESAGMMEIRGYKDGERLKIVPEKNFRICMHSKNPDPKFNLYHLNDEDKKWDYEGKDSISNPVETASDTTGPFDITNSGISEKEIAEVKTEITESEEVVQEIKKEIRKIKKTEPSKPKRANPKKKNFTIDVVKTEYPELATYTGTIFEALRNEDLPEDTYSVTWNGVELKEKNNGYEIHLTKGKRTEEIAVIPVLEGKNYDEAKSIFDSKFGEYSNKLEKKKNEEKQAKIDLDKLKEKFKREQEKTERRLQATRDQMNAVSRSTATIQRVFKINRFGTWNCDTPVKFPRGLVCSATYKDLSGNEIEFVNLNLIEKERNACFPLTTGMMKKLNFNPKRTNVLWGVTTNGEIAVANSKQFEDVKNRQTFEMMLIDVKGKSPSEIKKIISS